MIIWGLILAVGVLELSVRAYVQHKTSPQLISTRLPDGSFAYLHSPAFIGLPYDTEAFFLEMESFNEVDQADRQYIHIQNFQRQTRFQPDVSQNTIYFFGSSNVFGLQVPDEYTICSLLQDAVNRVYDGKYKVINFASMGMMISDQAEQYKTLAAQIQPGDVVVFYDGYNEMRRFFYAETNSLEALLLNSIVFRNLIRPLFANTMPATFMIANENAHQSYLKMIPLVEQDVKQRGALFIHFIEPSLYTLGQLSSYERQIWDQLEMPFTGWSQFFIAGYQRLRDANQLLMAMQVATYDITDALDHDRRTTGSEIFLDAIHTNAYGMQMIVDAMIPILLDHLPAAP